MKDLVSKLRTFSRLDEGTVKTINIHESIESVLLFLRHKMEGRIEVERNYGDVEMLTCLAGELNQVLMNIVANAIDAIDAADGPRAHNYRHGAAERPFRDSRPGYRQRNTGRRSAIEYSSPSSQPSR